MIYHALQRIVHKYGLSLIFLPPDLSLLLTVSFLRWR
jgi:hypothetical protein